MADNETSDLRVLIEAYACDPFEGSEPAVGWNWSIQASRFAEVHVITRSNNRPAIERGSPAGPKFHYVDLSAPLRRLKKKGGTFGLLAYYYLWQLKAARLAKRLHRQEPFDLIHHVTFANDWMPSGLASIPDRPFIWGPIGGSTHTAPPEVEEQWSPTARKYERRRRLMQRAVIRFDPLLRRTIRRTRLALPYTNEAATAPHLPERKRVVTHIGMDAPADPRWERPPEGPLRVATGGRLVHWKGHDLLLRAVALVLQNNPQSIEVTVTGSGPNREALAALVDELGIKESVRFSGRLPTQDDVVDLVKGAHLYALPTWRDGPPVAILEAMSVATPPLCLDLGATAELVPDGCGLKIRPEPLDSLVERIADGLKWALTERATLAGMGRSAAEHVATHHDWDEIGAAIGQIYQELAGDGRSRV